MRKKNLTQNDLSTSIFSGQSHKNNFSIQAPLTQRPASLDRAIGRIKQQDRETLIGISTISQRRTPKRQSYFDIKQIQNKKRIQHPSQEPKINLNANNQKNDALRKIFSLQTICKSQSALQLAAQKYSVRRITTDEAYTNVSPRPKLLDKFTKEIIERKSKNEIVKKILKDEVKHKIPKKSKEINYELDTLFQNYEKYAQQCLTANSIPNKPIIYNGYFKIYSSSQKEPIILDSVGDKDDTPSDESIAYKDFIDEVDEAIIQRDVYHSNLRNPFLDDKVTVKQMKKAGFLKRRPTEV